MLHLQEEQHHSDWLLDGVRKTATTQEQLARVTAGARQIADGWHEFWNGMYREVFQERDPA